MIIHLALVYLVTSPLYIKLVTVVEGDLKAPFLIATTQRCW